MEEIYYPPVSELIDSSRLPEEISFVNDFVEKILDNIYYRNFIIERSVIDSSVLIYVDIISFSQSLKIQVPGTGLILTLNPDISTNGSSLTVIPIVLNWNWKILDYIKNFKIENFSSEPKELFNIIFKLINISNDNLLSTVSGNFTQIDEYIDDSDSEHEDQPDPNPSLSEPVFPPSASSKIEDDILPDFDSNVTLEADKLEYFVNEVKTLHPELAIQQPLTDDITYEEILSSFNAANIDIKDMLFEVFFKTASINSVSSIIGSLISNFSSKDIFILVKELLIPRLAFSTTISAGLEIPRDVLLPIGIDGKVILDNNVKTTLLFDIGNLTFATNEGFGFDDNVRLSFHPTTPKAQIGSTGIVISFTNAKLDLSTKTNIPEADAAGYPTDFVGLYAQSVSVEFIRFGADDTERSSIGLFAENLLIGTGGVSGTIGLRSNGVLYRKFGNFAVELNEFSLTFRQGAILGSTIRGEITIPRFKKGDAPAVLSISAAIKDNGDFIITAEPQAEPLKITLPGVFELLIYSISIGNVDDRYFISVSGRLDFIADIPGLGNILPKNIEIHKLLIWDNGSIEFQGGKIPLPKAFRLNVGPVALEVSDMSLGAYKRMLNGVERKYTFFGFDGMLNTGRAGVNFTGNGIKFYFTTDDNGLDKPFHCFLSIDQIIIDLSIPGNVDRKDAAFLLNGLLSMKNPDPAISGSNAGSEYTGSVTFTVPKLKIAGSAAMRLDPSIPSFIVDVGLEVANPIPLGATGLGIYGFRGLVGQHYVPAKVGTETWWDYYKRPSAATGREGITIDKFANKPGFSLGAGVSIATAFDSGKIFSSKLFLLLGLPDVFLIQGQAAILRDRIGLQDDVDPPFSALIVIGDKSFQAKFGVNYNLPEKGGFKGGILSLQATLDMAFFFNNASGWYINIGKDQPESERVRASVLSLFQGYAYLMLSSRGIKAGAGAKFDAKIDLGIVGAGLGAYVNVGGFISFKPIQIGGFVEVGGYIYFKILWVKLSLSISARLAAEAPNPFIVTGSVEISFRVIKRFRIRVGFTWEFNRDRSPLLQPIPVLGLPNPATGYLPAVATNILTNETFPVNYVLSENTSAVPAPDSAAWRYNFTVDAQAENVTVPLDSFIDIELLKPVKPGGVNLGGAGNQLPAGYMELIPPQKGKSDQVRHEFELVQFEISAWNDSNRKWVPYHVYKAVTAIVNANNIPNPVDLDNLKPGFWQFMEPNKYNKIRLLSQNMFSYLAQSTSTTADLDARNFLRKDLFCFESVLKEIIIDWRQVASGTAYQQTVPVAFKGTSFVFQDVDAVVATSPSISDEALKMESRVGSVTITFPKPISSLKIDFGENQNNISVSYLKTTTIFLPFFFLIRRRFTVDLPVRTDVLNAGMQNTRLVYNDLANPVDKIKIEFNKSISLDYNGDLTYGGHLRLEDKFDQIGLVGFDRDIEQDKAVFNAALYSRSFSEGEIVSGQPGSLPGAVGIWPLFNVRDKLGVKNGILTGSPDRQQGFYERDVVSLLQRRDVYAFTANNDSVVIPYTPGLKVENGSFSLEMTAVFNPFLTGISTLFQKVYTDPVSGYKQGIAIHLIRNASVLPDSTYANASAVPLYSVWVTFYHDRVSSGLKITDRYTMDCDSLKITAKQYKHIFLSVDRSAGRLELFLDRIKKLSAAIPTELNIYDPALKPTFLNQISYLAASLQARVEENEVTEAKLIDEVQVLNDSLNKTIQPVWRPNTTYAVSVKTQDRVDGNPQGIKTHIFGFKTAGPVGHFHQKNKQYHELSEKDRADAFKLTNLKFYIDYERSFPDAQSRYDLSKPVFYKDPQVKLFFLKPYMNAMFSNWDAYQNLTSIDSKLQLQLLDPFGNIVTQELEWQPVKEFPIDISNLSSLPEDQQAIYWMNQAASLGSCNPMLTPVKKRLKQGIYRFPDISPNKLYTAIFNTVYKPANLTESSVEVHRFNFKTSRYVDFEEQAGSFVLNEVNGAPAYAVYPLPVSFTNAAIEQTLKKLINDNVQDDPADMLRYGGKYDRLIYGGLNLKGLEVADRTIINLIVNTNETGERQILGILIRNPEPFNEPKLPATNLSDTLKLNLTTSNGQTTGYAQFIYIHSRDTSAILITNAAMNIPVGKIQLSFQHKIFNGMDYVTEHEDYQSPEIDLNAYVQL